MSTDRIAVFAGVGAMGFVVQLALLAILTSVAGWPYLLATCVAVEAAVLHNFAWHEQWTWADRPVEGVAATAARLLRFNLTNGLLSVLGNMFFMHLFAGVLGLDPVIASVASIAPCALVNFLVSDRWVFLAEEYLPPLADCDPAVEDRVQ